MASAAENSSSSHTLPGPSRVSENLPEAGLPGQLRGTPGPPTVDLAEVIN